jgi:hypothetical protein
VRLMNADAVPPERTSMLEMACTTFIGSRT